MGNHALQCFQCRRVGGQGSELTMTDFGVDANSGTIVCKDCYTSPKDNKVHGGRNMQDKGAATAAHQGIALAKAAERAAAARRR